jgi:hypothetical protein
MENKQGKRLVGQVDGSHDGMMGTLSSQLEGDILDLSYAVEDETASSSRLHRR